MRISVSCQFRYRAHYSADKIGGMIQQECFSYDFRRSKQPPRHIFGHDSFRCSGIKIGVIIRFAGYKIKFEYFPEGIVRLQYAATFHFARRLGCQHRFLKSTGDADCFRDSHFFETSLCRVISDRAVALPVRIRLILESGITENKHSVTMGFRRKRSNRRSQSDNNHHYHSNGQCRAYDGDGRKQFVFFQQMECLFEVEFYHS